MTSNSDPARFRGMFELPVTAVRGNHKPSVLLDQLDDIPNLHGGNIITGFCDIQSKSERRGNPPRSPFVKGGRKEAVL